MDTYLETISGLKSEILPFRRNGKNVHTKEYVLKEKSKNLQKGRKEKFHVLKESNPICPGNRIGIIYGV